MKIGIVTIMGGLGNQMFQYAFYRNLKKKGFYVIPFIAFRQIKHHNMYLLDNIFDVNIYKFIKNNLISKLLLSDGNIKKRFQYLIFKVARLTKSIKDDNNIKLKKKSLFNLYYGYWQSEYFFDDIKSEINDIFSFPKINDKSNLKIMNLIKNTNSISVHIRRGDYLKEKYLKVIDKEYYKVSIDIIKNKIKNPYFFVFSDDINWCKENIKIDKKIFFIDWNKGTNSYIDMQLMSYCKHNIIANSTFSWWGAYLNQNKDKIIISPRIWMVDEHGNEINMNQNPKEWIEIDNL